jgi:hypothetical protein
MVKYSKKNNTRKNKNIKDNNITNFQKEITLVFLEVLLMIKLYHWKTKSYPTHEATDKLYSKLNEHFDKFIEVLLGKTNERIEMTNKQNFKLIDCNSKNNLINNLNNFQSYLVNLDSNKAIQSIKNSDLFTIRDEILADTNQFLYLLTFH